MHLNRLSLVNFKNYDQVELEFNPKINCFVGDNGAGKTNLLDAIYYLSLTKSYFNTIDTQNIMHDRDFFVIQGEYERDNIKESIYCGVKKNNRKIFKRNNKEYSRLLEHIGLLPVVMISPADGSLITEGSDERRKFINAVISQYDIRYLDSLIRYNRALVQRNILLKESAKTGNSAVEMLEIWDEQLIPPGNYIYEKRTNFANNLLPIFQKYYTAISENRETVELKYISQLHDVDFNQLVRDAREKDKILQYSTAGVHKDDLVMNIDGHPIKKNGSQGQQKTFLVALKFAKFEFIKVVNGFKPILLLDDVFDKFDATRVKQIITLVADQNFGQIFITDTYNDRVKAILSGIDVDYKLFLVENGQVKEKK